MYMLMPDEPHIGFITLAVIFVSATLLGFASHSPGGLGVFDAAMLVALWQFDKEELLAGLLLFRLLYYIMPFALSLPFSAGAKSSRALRRPPLASPPWLPPRVPPAIKPRRALNPTTDGTRRCQQSMATPGIAAGLRFSAAAVSRWRVLRRG